MGLKQKSKDSSGSGAKHSLQNGEGSNGHAGASFHSEKLPLLLNSLPAVITYVDSNHHLQYVNSAFEKMFNLKYAAVVGKPLADFMGIDGYLAVKGYIDEVLSGKVVHYEMEVPLKGGKRYLDTTYTPDFDDQGKVIGYITLINDISEKKKTEKELEKKRLELEDYVSNASVGLHWVNSKGIITWANQAELNMLGYPQEEYIGRPIAEFHVSKAAIDDILKRLFNNEVLNQYEAELRHKDGSIRTVLISSSVFWEDGKFAHTRCFTTDITERKRMEASLRESRGSYHSLLESMPAALYTCDAEGRITMFNKAAAELWGREPVIGKDMWCGSWKIFEPDGVTPMELDTCPMAIALKEGGRRVNKEIVVERPDGKKLNVQPYPVALFDANGKVTGAVNMLLDITDHKISEKEFAHLAAIVRSSADAVISKTLTGIITSWNTAAERMFGYSAEEMIGQSVLRLIPEDRLDEETLILERLRRGEAVEHFETKRITKDKRILDISLTISPVRDKNGNVIGASKIARDITEQTAIIEALLESEERLRMASDATELGTWEFHPLTDKLIWSAECKKIHNVPIYFEPTNEFVSENMHPDDRGPVHDEVVKAMDPNGSGSFYIQYRFYRNPGRQLRWLRNRGKVYFDEQGQAYRFIGTMLDVTEEKQAEQVIRESEERLRLAIQATKLGTWEFFPLTGELNWSEECKKIYALPAGVKVDFKVFAEHIHPEDKKYAEGEIQKSMDPSGNGRYDIEYRILRFDDGSPRWIRAQGQVFFNKEGKAERFIGTVLDITEQKLAQSALEESEERTRLALDAASMGTFNWNLDTRELISSQRLRDIFGFTGLQNITQEEFTAALHPEDKAVRDEAAKKSLESGFLSHETRICWSDKSIHWIKVFGKIIFDEQRRPLKLYGIVVDTTAEKTVIRALEEGEQRKRLAIEAANMGTFDWDLVDHDFVSSRRLNDIFGFHNQTNIRHTDLINALHPEDKPARDKAVKESAEKGSLSYEARIVWPDKTLHWVRIFGKIIYDENKKPLRMHGIAVDVTLEKTTITDLEESRARLNLAIDAAELGMWELQLGTDQAIYSDRYLEIMGFEPGSTPDHKELLKSIHPNDIPKREKAINDALETGVMDFEMRIQTKEKKIRWIRVKGKVLYDENHVPEKMLGTTMDITETKRMLNAVKESEERFKTIANTAPVMIWMSGSDKFPAFFNTSWLNFTGHNPQEEGKGEWLDNVHPDDLQKCIDDHHRSFVEQKEFYSEYRLRRHDGRYRWIADNSVPRHNPDGSFAGFISACMDIDDQKNFSEKIRKSELLLKTISNAAPVGLWMTDAKAQNTFVNETWIEWTGIPYEKQLGVGWLDQVLEEDKVDAPSKFWECLLKREKYTTEFRILRADGELRWCLTEGSPYYDIDGEFAGYAGSVTDITDMKKVEERKDDFIKMASHELKTPITSIKGYVQLLLKIYEEQNEEQFQLNKKTVKSSLGTISNQVSKLTRLVSELLDLSRIESGKLDLHKSEFSLEELVDETVQDVRQTTSSHTILAQSDFNGKLYADKDRISQVLINLLTNAIKYSPAETNVEVFVTSSGDMVFVKVKDYGIGIDKKDQDMIFQRFYRVEGKSEQTYPGFGIGLFIASEIVQRHEGNISVESKKDVGSIFTISLPLRQQKNR